jgi:hypothetical protein
MQWAAAEQHATVVNLSLGGEDDPGVVDPLEQAVQTLTDRYHTLFVVAAGNADGPTDGAIDSPGSADAALTVGAVNDADTLADFSRRGPRPPDDGLKPDITAPGVDITAARGRDATSVPGKQDDQYTTLSGTSMATPHVAGAAAILAQQHPDWSGQQLKAALMASARPNQTTGAYAQGAGRLDVARAVGQSVTSNPASVSFGRQLWPHTDDPVLTRSVTYYNDGAIDVALTLRVAAFGPGGAPTPAGMFTLSATSVRVPARGDATVAVSVDTRVAGPDGYTGGWLIATAGDLAIRTPVAVNKEVESYDVTLTHLDRAGATPAFFSTDLGQRDGTYRAGWLGPDPGGTVTLRVPRGHYTVLSTVFTVLTSSAGAGAPAQHGGEPEPPPISVTLLAQPDLDVNQPRTLILDARLGQPVSVTVPQPSARQVYADVGAGITTASHSVLGESFADLYSARIGPDQPDDRFFSHVAGQWARANPDGTTGDFAEWSGDDLLSYSQATSYVHYEAGRAYHERWNSGVFAPSLAAPSSFDGWQGVTRAADTIGIEVPLFSDGAGHPGVSGRTTSSNATLFRNGTRIGSTDPTQFGGSGIDVAPDDASYRLEVHVERGAPYTLSTKTTVAWTFRSGHVDGTTPVPLALWAIRFAPELDRYNTAPNGVDAVPVLITPQQGARVGTLVRRTVEASFDDGVTWTLVPLQQGAAMVRHPAGSGFVSLRAKASDTAGNTVEQTIIHAYRYG